MARQVDVQNINDDVLVQGLLKYYQRDFPIVSRPFQVMAETLASAQAQGYSEADVLNKLIALKEQDVLTRIGPIFDHKRAGASLLAAVSVPQEKIAEVAEKINSFAEVNHNYGREHHFNLWFVVTAPNKMHLHQALSDMEIDIGYPILRLPMIRSYYIDLGFQVTHDKIINTHNPATQSANNNDYDSSELLCELDQHRLRVLIQDGLPLVAQPFIYLAEQLGFASENQIIHTLKSWLGSGLIKRIGLVTNHHQLGYTSNAMVVWDVPDNLIDIAGEKIKQSGLVSLCYQRQRHLPEWPYNLYCMIHSRDRGNVQDQVARLIGIANLQAFSSEVLFTTCQYKQKGGLYSVQSDAKAGHVKGESSTQNGAIKKLGVM